MINKSIRVYSLKEIHEFIRNNEYPNELLEYVKAAPDGIQRVLIEMGVEPQQWIAKEAESIDYSSSGERVNTEPGETKEEGSSHEEKEVKVLPIFKADDGRESQKDHQNITTSNTVDKPRDQNDEDIYKDLRFGDSITVKRLVLHEMKQNSCKLHARQYENIRVVVLMGKRSFAVRTSCCPMCKQLFVRRENFLMIKRILDRKKVNYKWVPEGK